MTPARVTRAREGRIVAGVCAGLGRYTGIDPLVFRIVFALLMFATWCALPLYIVAALLMSDEDGEPAPLERLARRRLDGGTVLALLGVLLVAGILLGITGQGLLNSLDGDALAALVIVALIALVTQAKGVDLVEVARTLPDRLRGEPLPTMETQTPRPTEVRRFEWIDLATLQPITIALTVEERPRTDLSGLPDLPNGPGRTEPAKDTPAVKPEGHGCAGQSPLPVVTLLLASIAGTSSGLIAAHQPGLTGLQIMQVASATALAVVALGLVAGAWIGRTNGLLAVGALLSLALIGSSAATDVQDGARFGDVSWRPVDPNATQPYRIIAGQGVLDLTALPLRDGERYRVEAELGLGSLRVVLPVLAQVELHVSTALGDITVDKKITSGPRARVERTLPGSGTKPPVVELHIKSRLGDLEVVRGRA